MDDCLRFYHESCGSVIYDHLSSHWGENVFKSDYRRSENLELSKEHRRMGKSPLQGISNDRSIFVSTAV